MTIKPEFTDEVLQFAQEIFDYAITEIEEGSDWGPTYRKLTEAQKAGLFSALADAFNDSVEG
jgi:hypothetical protein